MDDLATQAAALADGVALTLPRWVERGVDRVYRAWAGPPPAAVVEAARRAGTAAADDVGARIRALLATDIDEQRTTPLALLRAAVRYPTGVLADAGVPEVQRDPTDAAMFPGDVYGLTPATFADVDPSLADLGRAWGAAKAWVHRRRHAPAATAAAAPEPAPAAASVVAYVPDLMDRSKVVAALPTARMVRTPAEMAVAAGPGVTVIVDLGRPGVVEAIAPMVAAGARVIGFGSHVDRALLEAAGGAGCSEVLARSAFFNHIAAVVG